MKLPLGLMVLGIAFVSCSKPRNPGPDVSVPARPPNDLREPEPAGPGPALRLVAGGLGGGGNADDTGRLARFSQPTGIAADGVGNLYVADSDNHTVRKVVISTGEVTTLAGLAGKPGAAAQLRYPKGITAGGPGNLYIADSDSCTIHKLVISSGEVTTLAGLASNRGSSDGTGSAARFNQPTGIAADGAGNLYVADSDNHAIRKVVISTGVVTTLAGRAGTRGSADGPGLAAQFNNPFAVAADGAGNLYVADTGNNTIRKVAVATGVVTTLAGLAGQIGEADGAGAEARIALPTGVTLDRAGNLYVNSLGAIRKVVIATGMVTTLAGLAGALGSVDGTGAAARFNRAHGVATDGAGNLYIADTSNNTIRKLVIATGVVTTLAGRVKTRDRADATGAAALLDSPARAVLDGSGNLYVSDSFHHTISKVVVATGAVTTLAGTAGKSGYANGTGAAAQFNTPAGVALDGAGILYVADSGNHDIRRVVLATGVVTTLAGGARGSADGIGAGARFRYPDGVAADDAGNLYVTDTGNNTIRRVALSTGEVSTLAGTADKYGNADGTGAAARFFEPTGLVLDATRNLYIADTNNHTIRKMVVATAAVTTLAGTAGKLGSDDGIGTAARFNRPLGIALDGAGNLYVADSNNATLRKIVLASAQVTTPVGLAGQRGVRLGSLPARLNRPTGVAVSPAGELFLVESFEPSILVVR